MASVCNEDVSNEEVDEAEESIGYGSLLCFMQCLNSNTQIMSSERDNVIQHLSTKSAKFEALLRKSQFDNFPPTIKFYNRTKKDVEVAVKRPTGIYKSILKWSQSTLLSHVMKRTLRTSHFELIPQVDNEWRGFWGKHLRSAEYKTLNYWQNVNHFPGDFHIGRKDRLWQHICEKSNLYPGFDIMPTTYVLPKDHDQLCTYLNENPGKHVILKPPASARGRGITIVDSIDKISTEEPLIAQHYIENPLLINGAKFDLRIYVYVSSLSPLLVYIYNDGLVRFASLPYDSNDFGNEYMHLTNFSVNKLAKKNGVTDIEVSELKWSLNKFWNFVRQQEKDPDELWKRIIDVAVRSVISCSAAIHKQQISFCPFPFLNKEVFGMDVMIDSEFKPWILEMNISPSMQTATQEDVIVKTPLVANILNMWGLEFVHKNDVEAVDLSYRVKPIELHKTAEHISKETENMEFYAKTGKISPEILTQLTDADLRYLMNFENEYVLRENFDLIYPAADTIAQYLPCSDPTYADLLLTAWISLDERQRNIGIQRLQKLAKSGAHLSEEGFVDDDESVINDKTNLSDYASV